MGMLHRQSSKLLVQHEFDPQGQNVNYHFSGLSYSMHLWEADRLKYKGKWNAGDWLLHNNNAPAHSALSVQ
jgi:hypothetical protein